MEALLKQKVTFRKNFVLVLRYNISEISYYMGPITTFVSEFLTFPLLQVLLSALTYLPVIPADF